MTVKIYYFFITAKYSWRPEKKQINVNFYHFGGKQVKELIEHLLYAKY